MSPKDEHSQDSPFERKPSAEDPAPPLSDTFKPADKELAQSDANPSNHDTPPVSETRHRGSPATKEEPLDTAPSRSPNITGYEILREIHRGGQGVVYQAIQRSTKRKVAIKLLLEGAYASKSARKRFEREVELVAQLRHPNIIGIFHSGRTPEGYDYFVMDYVRGTPLDLYVRETKLPLENVLQLFITVCDAVTHAHQKGVIHRDLKPSNILVDRQGVPRVLDFGLAKQMAEPLQSLVSVTGQIVGTLPYMSPEQAEGNPEGIDIRTDVYALGVILYQMLTGHFPYPVVGQMADVLRHITESTPTPPSRQWTHDAGVTTRSSRKLRAGQCPIDEEVQTIVLCALAKEPARRYQSAADLAQDIERYLADEPIEAKKDSGWYVLKKNLSRYRRTAIFGLVLFLLVTGFAITMTIMSARYAALAQSEAAARRKAADAETEQRRLAESEAAARQRADAKAAEAQAALETIEYNSYVSNIQLAASAFYSRRTERGRHRLYDCPMGLLGWEWDWLFALSDSCLTSLMGHTGSVYSAAFSPDGNRIVTASWDNTARVWDTKTGTQVVALLGHTGAVKFAAFSPDGDYIVTASWDNTAQIWDAKTGKNVAELAGHTSQVVSAAFSPDGNRIITASWDTTARIWDASTGTGVAELVGHNDNLLSVAFSPDGDRIVTASQDKTARVWDANTGARVAELMGHTGSLNSAAFSPDGSRIVTASQDKTARVWDANTGNQVAKLVGHTGEIYSADFGPVGERIVTASTDKTARVWDANTGARVAELMGHAGSVNSAAFSPDGNRVVTASRDKTARVWDANKGKSLAEIVGHRESVLYAAFSPNSNRIVTVSEDNTAQVWDPSTRADKVKLEGHGEAVLYAAFSSDGNRIITASRDKTARVWDANTGASVAQLVGHTDAVSSAVFSPDGRHIFTTSLDDTARVWNTETYRSRSQFVHLRGPAHIYSWLTKYAAFGPHGNRIVTASTDNSARVWDATNRAWITELKGHTKIVVSSAFSADGKRIVTTSMDNTARVWDADTGACVAELKGHTREVLAAAFSPDGTHVVTASWDNTARVWKVATGECVVRLVGHTKQVHSASFSPDGKRIVTASQDNTARVWDSVPYRERFPRIDAMRKAVAKYRSQFEEALASGTSLDDLATSVLDDVSLGEIDRTAAQIVIFELRQAAMSQGSENVFNDNGFDGDNGS